ncbi:MAG: carboxypeptidase-like regulatory domain-containing protein, partial [Melioribacteraceae bacterium]|nr:carboxypeptidase-like regulatory domain-containing protein [Melioribacteraceae bacterium]
MDNFLRRFGLSAVLLIGSIGIAFSQFTVSGSISDVYNNPLIGASILVKGTTVGTTTGIDGDFSIQVPGEDGILIISYIGFQTQEIAVDRQSTEINITLAEDIARLDEVVVTGLASGV